MGKSCSSCGEFKDYYKGFSKTKKSKDGFKSQCKDCERAYRTRSKSEKIFKRPKLKEKLKEHPDRLELIKTLAEKYKKPKDEFLDIDPIEEDNVINEELVEIYDYEDLEYLLTKEQLH